MRIKKILSLLVIGTMMFALPALATVTSATQRNDYTATGTASVYLYTYRIFSNTNLLVTVREPVTLLETTLTLTTDYTVTGVGNVGGSITLVDASQAWIDGDGDLVLNWAITIRRVLPLTQNTDIRNQGSYFPETHEDQFDRELMIAQQQQDEIDRSIKLPETSSNSGILATDIVADQAIFGDAAGTGLEFRKVVVTEGTYPGSFTAGLDSAKAASPGTNDVYIATDTKKLYICYSSGTWSTERVFSDSVHWAKGADIASGTSIALGTDGNAFDITGTTTIQTITAKQAGFIAILHFDGALTLTDDTGNLELQGSDLTVAAEDEVILKSDGTNWHLVASSNKGATSVLTTQGDILYRDASGLQRLAPGTTDKFLQTKGAAANPTWTSVNEDQSQAGSIVQVVNTQTGAVAVGTTVVVHDDGIPENDEGDEYMTLAITPTNTNNKLFIQAIGNFAHSTNNINIMALYQDSTVNALAAVVNEHLANVGQPFVLNHFMTAGTTSATTFKIRWGSVTAGDTTFNGIASGRKLGGVMASSITITEVKV